MPCSHPHTCNEIDDSSDDCFIEISNLLEEFLHPSILEEISGYIKDLANEYRSISEALRSTADSEIESLELELDDVKGRLSTYEPI